MNFRSELLELFECTSSHFQEERERDLHRNMQVKSALCPISGHKRQFLERFFQSGLSDVSECSPSRFREKREKETDVSFPNNLANTSVL